MSRSIRALRALAAIVALGVAVGLGALYEEGVEWATGPSYWRWPFHDRPPAIVLTALLPLVALVVIAVATPAMRARGARLAAAMGAAFAWMELWIVGVGTDGRHDLSRIVRIVLHRLATSYWSAAMELVRAPHVRWLDRWHVWMQGWPLHARNKPPLPVLYYVAMHDFAGEAGAFLGPIVLMLVAALIVPATHRFALAVGCSARGAIHAAALAALAPALSIVAPELDQVYPLITIAAAGSWVLALRRGSLARPAVGLACATGAAMFVATMFAFHLATIGLPLALLALPHLRREPGRVARLALAALAVFVALHAAMYALFRYDTFAVFEQAMADRATMLSFHERVGPESRVFDLTDFGLGIGWPCLVAALAGLVAIRRSSVPWRVGAAGLALVLLLAMGRLLPTETARTWMFLIPFFTPLAGAHLAGAGPRERAVHLAAAVAFLAVVAHRVFFIIL